LGEGTGVWAYHTKEARHKEDAFVADLSNYVEVMPADMVEEGEMYPFDVDDEQLMLAKVDGEIHALSGICTHEYAELWEGDIEDDTIWCPLHSSGFNVKSGAATNFPAVIPLPVYDVQIVDGTVYVSREPVKNAPD
jgi:3-phenylpropionate/trans-cinnamate dioxygenase ferredoxin component